MKNTTIQPKIDIPLVDSKEVLQEYYVGKLIQLAAELDRLNLQEHPVEIESICIKMIAIKKKLNLRGKGQHK